MLHADAGSMRGKGLTILHLERFDGVIGGDALLV